MRIDWAKLALLIPRLAFDFEGEVAATARFIRRLLDASGQRLHDLTRAIGPITQYRRRSRITQIEKFFAICLCTARSNFEGATWIA
jgi:hypothetical protein